jgi:hypothetical protein
VREGDEFAGFDIQHQSFAASGSAIDSETKHGETIFEAAGI